MHHTLPDISSRDDIKSILNKFYEKAKKDFVIGDKFKNINMDLHLETITNFWDSIIFGSDSYHGDPFGKHIAMRLEKKHFNRWLELFINEVDTHFAGKNAEEMKMRGRTIAQVFQYKLS